MSRHDELRKTWQPGQYWETCNLNRDGTLMEQWCPVGNGGYAEPMWDEHQEYRQGQPHENIPQVRCPNCGAIIASNGHAAGS